MNSPFVIVYDNFLDKTNEAQFIEVLTSSFISKKGKNYMYFISVDTEKYKEAKDIYNLLASKLKFDSSFIVIELSNFYGAFSSGDVLDWVKEQFPNWHFIT